MKFQYEIFHKLRNRGCNTDVFVFSNILCSFHGWKNVETKHVQNDQNAKKGID